jgi:hypothetical protein
MEHQMSAKVVFVVSFQEQKRPRIMKRTEVINKYLKRTQSKIQNSQTKSLIYSYFENIIVNKLLE